jgi:hypothetical protein
MLAYDWTTRAYQLGWMLLAGAAGFSVTVAAIGFYRRRATPGGDDEPPVPDQPGDPDRS